jgi:hypothetical protein
MISRSKPDRTRARQPVRHRRILLACCLGVILTWVGLLAFAPRGRSRWEKLNDSSLTYRLQVWRDGLRTLSDFPIVGSGLGSFRTVFPKYKSGTFSSETTHAENEYLQWGMETGAFGSVLMAIVGISFYGGALTRYKSRRNTYQRNLAAGALLGITCIGVHNFVDFNMHIPSNALTLAAVASLCILAVHLRRGFSENSHLFTYNTFPLRSAGGTGLLACALILAALIGTRSWKRYDSLRLQARWLQNQPGDSGAPDLELLREAAKKAPANGKAHYLQAMTLESDAARKGLFAMQSREGLLEAASHAVFQAVAIQPADASYWSLFGRIESSRQQGGISDQAFSLAVSLSPANGYIRRDYGISLVQNGGIEKGTAQLVIARYFAAEISLREILDLLSTRTADRKIWETVVRNDPEDLNVYAGFLRSRGFTDLGNQLQKQADSLNKKPN